MKQAEELKERTKQFAVRIVRLFQSLPKTEEARVLGRHYARVPQLEPTIAPFADAQQGRVYRKARCCARRGR
jgi:hypothetical protein